MERIISNYVTEYCNNQHICVGINSIREILTRMPLALTEDQIEYLCLFRANKNKSVASSAKSLVNLFRDICPEMLPKKMRGRFNGTDETNQKENFVFGQEKINYDIDGIDLLKKAEKHEEKANLAAADILDDKTLRKIKILKLKEEVRKVDRHGFRDEDKIAQDAVNHGLRVEYYEKMRELLQRKGKTGKNLTGKRGIDD